MTCDAWLSLFPDGILLVPVDFAFGFVEVVFDEATSAVGFDVAQPVLPRPFVVACFNANSIAPREFGERGTRLSVDGGRVTPSPYVGVDRKSEVEYGCAFGQDDGVTLGREGHNLFHEENSVQLVE